MISRNIVKRPFRCAGNGSIYNVSGHAGLVSQASDKGFTQLYVGKLLDNNNKNIAVTEYCHIGVPKASK